MNHPTTIFSADLAAYARSELVRLFAALTKQRLIENQSGDAIEDCLGFSLAVNGALNEQEVAIRSTPQQVAIQGGSPAALLHGVYTFFEKLGCVFEFSGEVLPAQCARLTLPTLDLRHIPSVRERGIRMHLNFFQDQSFFTEAAFKAFIDTMARQRFNYLQFHLYTPLQWFPFTYRGIKHLAHQFRPRQPLSPAMIGRDRVNVRDRWAPVEFESIDDPEGLLHAMHGRFQQMMARAHARGIRNCVSFEPESLPPALAAKLPEWTGKDTDRLLADKTLAQQWQESWSGTALAEADIRHPLVIDIAVERCLQCIDAFPDLDELQLMSCEGTAWKPKPGQSYATELERLTEKFGLPAAAVDHAALQTVVTPDEGPEMLLQAHPYWTVLPGDNFYATVVGSLRYVEFALAILADPRVRAKVADRRLEVSISVYSPHPETVRLMMPGIAAMLPEHTRFGCLADYGARDITANLPAWQPLTRRQHRIGMISWLEFDGVMALAQGWTESLCENVKRAQELGVETITFNHWRVRSLEPNAAAAAAFCWDSSRSAAEFFQDYFSRLYGAANVAQAAAAHRALEAATLYAKKYNYNVGFAGDWVIKISTNTPGYYWRRLATSRQNYQGAQQAFAALAATATGPGQRQAAYLADICQMSVLHLEAVAQLQNAKLPLVGYKAWPLGNERACWPPPDKLAELAAAARQAATLAEEYLRVYARWVTSCDEQGHLCAHQQGVVEPFTHFADTLERQVEIETAAQRAINATG